MESGSYRHRRRFGLLLPAVVLSVVVAACSGDNGDALDSVDAIPGLAEADEVPLIETEPDPSDDSFNWTHAYEVGGVPPINLGEPTPEWMADFMADAHREVDEADHWVCLGAGGCDVVNDSGPNVTGLNFGGPDVLAWAWLGVPDQAVAVQFTDQNGTATWQRPIDHLVIFPDTIEGDLDKDCPCRFDAIDADGAVITSVDIQTLTYTTSNTSSSGPGTTRLRLRSSATAPLRYSARTTSATTRAG